MRVWATLGALLSVLAGAQIPADSDAERAEYPAGYCVDGGDFYVWDEDREEAERWATELARTRATAPPGQ